MDLLFCIGRIVAAGMNAIDCERSRIRTNDNERIVRSSHQVFGDGLRREPFQSLALILIHPDSS